ncbi:BlaI/MecI/CopY family transcriptional regulator [Aliidiomarina haloalkalitolerans]|uniref:Transcriptional regulator n=1 Tax=Aliidiomarina haloalkalitolerans TaxID=859059 RepID=A0A432VV68_9GAMM|nr:BlaI/MecI/CopY family transcriptional regulator [Aliidiomarina haloalkalitolerans]RUO20278.1 transcriptional regulator [Aliidiomarina haloalkalitolerans]
MVEVSNAELHVMQVLWKHSPQSAQEIVAQLQQEFDWHEKTIKTMLNRLTQKQAITFTKQGRSYLYSPAVSQQAYQQQASQSFVQRLFAGKVTPLVAHFAEKGKLSDSDIDELKSLIAKLEDKQ